MALREIERFIEPSASVSVAEWTQCDQQEKQVVVTSIMDSFDSFKSEVAVAKFVTLALLWFVVSVILNTIF